MVRRLIIPLFDTCGLATTQSAATKFQQTDSICSAGVDGDAVEEKLLSPTEGFKI